jgi:hypothetical protein
LSDRLAPCSRGSARFVLGQGTAHANGEGNRCALFIAMHGIADMIARPRGLRRARGANLALGTLLIVQ